MSCSSTGVRAGCGVAVSVVGLRKEFVSGSSSIAALRGVDLEIAAGEAVAIMGPSGSGKSTLLHLIAAMDAVSGGAVRVGECRVEVLRGARAARYRRTVGFVFQSFNLLSSLTALDNVLAPLIPFGEARRLEADAFALLDRVGIGPRADALPGELSGGERQRVAIARSLINRPTLLLADEPTGNLDSATGEAVVNLLLSLRAEHGMTLVIATHDPNVSGALERVVTLSDGRVV
jgi:putative ABC transport system ATP-binding protein